MGRGVMRWLTVAFWSLVLMALAGVLSGCSDQPDPTRESETGVQVILTAAEGSHAGLLETMSSPKSAALDDKVASSCNGDDGSFADAACVAAVEAVWKSGGEVHARWGEGANGSDQPVDYTSGKAPSKPSFMEAFFKPVKVGGKDSLQIVYCRRLGVCKSAMCRLSLIRQDDASTLPSLYKACTRNAGTGD